MRRWIRGFLGATCIATLVACGGGGASAPAATTLGGVAAVGAPIVGGTVQVTCAAGSALTTTTSSTGAWQVTISGQTLPCAIQISGGTVNAVAQATSYHAVTLDFGIANITPLTDLITANLAGAAPSVWFSGLTGSSLRAITQNQINAALTQVSTALGLASALNGQNPITTAFSAVAGDVMDDILEALAAAGAAYGDLLARAQASGSFTAPAGFDFQTAFAAVRAANGGGGTGSSCANGQIALTYAASTAGGPHADGQTLCFTTISPTTLAFGSKNLTNPVRNVAVQAPFSAYQFADGAFSYEVVFNSGVLHEINVSDANRFFGQLTLSNGGGTGGTGGAAGSLEVSFLVNGVAGTTFNLPNIPAPADQASFCSALAADSTFASIGATGGGTLVVTGCSFANNVGTVNATLLGSIPYVVTYRYL